MRCEYYSLEFNRTQGETKRELKIIISFREPLPSKTQGLHSVGRDTSPEAQNILDEEWPQEEGWKLHWAKKISIDSLCDTIFLSKPTKIFIFSLDYTF